MIAYLHGFASSPQSFKAQRFASHFADLGISLEIPQLDEGDFENLTISSQLGVVKRLMSSATAPRVLIGSSLGGYLSALHASENPVEALVLMAPAVDFFARWHERLGPKVIEHWRKEGHMMVDHFGTRKQEKLSYALFEDARQHGPWPRVEASVLVFHGKQDDVVPQDRVERWCELNKAKLVLFDSGHELREEVDLIFEQTRDFLAAIPEVAKRYPSLSRQR